MKSSGHKQTISQSQIQSSQELQINDQTESQIKRISQHMQFGFKSLSLQGVQYQEKTQTIGKTKQKKAQDQLCAQKLELGGNQMEFQKDHTQYGIFSPITFFDTIVYKQKFQQIKKLISYGNPSDIIEWIEKNNQENFGKKFNCRLLAKIQSNQFWKNIVITMLDNVLQYSQAVGIGNLRLFTERQFTKYKYEVKRLQCYIILCQMFFGLIPMQFHHIKSKNKCTFAVYMRRQSTAKSNTKQKVRKKLYQEQSDQENDLTQEQIANLNKIKALLFYFSVMSVPQNQTSTKKQIIQLEFKNYKLKKNIFTNPDQAKKQKRVDSDNFQEDFGPIGDQILKQIYFSGLQGKSFKFNQGQMDQQLGKISSFFETQGLINDQATSNNLNYRGITKFLFQHPEAFVVKLMMPEEIDKRQCICISGLKQFSQCEYKQGITFESRKQCLSNQNLLKSGTKHLPRLILRKRDSGQNLSKENQMDNDQAMAVQLRQYSHKRVKEKIQIYQGCLKACIKGLSEKQVVIEFEQLSHRDPYLDFILMWISISSMSTFKFRFRLNFSPTQKQGRVDQFDIQKLYLNLVQKQVGDALNIIRSYEQFMLTKPARHPQLKSLSFLEYIKRHVF